MFLVQELRADNDPNGNGQWLHVVYSVDPINGLDPNGQPYAITVLVTPSDGYDGQPRRHAIAFGYPASELPSVRIPKSTYHATVKLARQRDTFRYHWQAAQ